MYLDFIVNLVDVRDVAAGLILAMEHGQIGHRYILGGESISLKKILQLMATISGRRYLAVPVPGKMRGSRRRDAGVHFRSRDAPSPVRHGRGCADRAAGDRFIDRKSAKRAWLCATAG